MWLNSQTHGGRSKEALDEAIERFKMSLATAPISKRLRITGVRGADQRSYRLMELGFIDGMEAEVIGRAPLGDPMHVRLGNFSLSLRASEAALIDIAHV